MIYCDQHVSSKSTGSENRIQESETHHNFNLNQESINIIKSNQFLPPSQKLQSQDKKAPYKSKQQFQKDMDEYLLDTQLNSSHKSTPKNGNFRLGEMCDRSNSKLNNSLIFNNQVSKISPLRLKNPGQMSKNFQRPNQLKLINQSTRMFGGSSNNTPLSSMSDEKNSDNLPDLHQNPSRIIHEQRTNMELTHLQ